MRYQVKLATGCLVFACAACAPAKHPLERAGGIHSDDAASPRFPANGALDGGRSGAGDRAVTGAGALDGSVPAPTICDGSDSVRLNYQVLVPPSPRDNGRDLLYDNYFVVQGNCSYWILRDAWSEARTGKLSEAEAVQLAAAVQYSAWAELAGCYLPSVPVFDAAPQRLTNGVAELLCSGLCRSPGDRVHAIFVETAANLERLYAAGRAVNGPMRVTALIYANSTWPENYQAIDWPLATQALEYFYEPAQQSAANPGVLVTDREALSSLRKLRKRVQDPGSLWSQLSFIPIKTAPSAPGSRVELYFRDVAPVEN